MEYMYKKIKSLLFHTLVPAVLGALMLPMTAFAQEDTISVSVPVEVQVSGSRIPSDVDYKLVIESVTPNAPLPAATEITIKDGGKSNFGPIVYTSPNDYQYRIRQNSEKKSYFTYDEREYTLTIRVTNAANGGLNAEIWAVDGENVTAKAENILFENRYYKSGGGGGGGGGGKDKPTAGDGLTTIEDGNTPLGNIITDMMPEVIPENLVPLSVLPKTGDTTNMALWLIMMAVSGSGLILLIVFGKRRGAAQ